MKKLLSLLGGCGGGCKKVLGLFLVVAMVLTVMPVTFAEDDEGGGFYTALLDSNDHKVVYLVYTDSTQELDAAAICNARDMVYLNEAGMENDDAILTGVQPVGMYLQGVNGGDQCMHANDENADNTKLTLVFENNVTLGQQIYLNGLRNFSDLVVVEDSAYMSFEYNEELHHRLIDSYNSLLSGFMGFFYRTNPVISGDTGEFLYGYGFGYSIDRQRFEYGYGFGYGYNGFWDNLITWMNGSEYAKLGFGMGSTYGDFALPVADGQITMPIAYTLEGPGDFSGAQVFLPEGLVLQGAEGWDGTVNIDTSLSLPEALTPDFASANVITVSTGGYAVGMSGPVVVTIPYPGFGDLTDPLVRMVDGAGDTYTITACGETYVGESSEDADMLSDPANYSLSANTDLASPQQCYMYYDGVVYIAVNHFTTFAAGPGASSGGDDDSGGHSGGGSVIFKKKVATDKSVDGSATTEEPGAPAKIADFTDLTKLVSTDWQYPVIQQVLDLGLMNGEMKAGKKVFNMYKNMNRASAAVVVCRYMGCDDTATVTVAPFSDAKVGDWFTPAVAYLKAQGVVDGKTETTFDPMGTVTRAEFFKMLVQAYIKLHPDVKAEWEGLMAKATTYFVDVEAGDWYAPYMNLAAQKSLLTGVMKNGKRYSMPNQNIYRVEGASMLVKMVGL